MLPIYKKISDQLEQYISDNAITGRMPGIIRLSDELGLNRVTLAKAVRELERRGVVTICGTKGTFVNDKVKKRTTYRVLALVGCASTQQGDNRLLGHLNGISRPLGYQIIGISFEEQLFRENPGFLLNFPVDGFIFRMSSLRSEQEAILRREDIPVVSGAYRVNCPWLDMTDCSHEEGYRKLLKYLKLQGHRRIAFVEFDRISEYRHYLEKVRAIFQEYLGSDYDPRLFHYEGDSVALYQEFGEQYCDEFGKQVMKKLFSRANPPTAVVAPTDIAWGLHRQMTAAGWDIPGDVSICGIGYETFGDEYKDMTLLVYSEKEMLEWALQRLLLRIQKGNELPGESYFQEPALKINKSTGPVIKKNINKKVTT